MCEQHKHLGLQGCTVARQELQYAGRLICSTSVPDLSCFDLFGLLTSWQSHWPEAFALHHYPSTSSTILRLESVLPGAYYTVGCRDSSDELAERSVLWRGTRKHWAKGSVCGCDMQVASIERRSLRTVEVPTVRCQQPNDHANRVLDFITCNCMCAVGAISGFTEPC